MKTRILIIALAAIVALMYWQRGFVRDAYLDFHAPRLPAELPARRPTPSTIIRTPGPSFTPTATPQAVPFESNLAVPFSSQAPHGNWGLPYQETCEEASAMLVDAFWDGRTFTPESADAELLTLVRWQEDTLGFYMHTTAEQTAFMLRVYYGYRDVRVSHDIGIGDIKREVAAGRPVIVPLAGRLVGNRFYKTPGPVYHMLVVKGFTADGLIITNDVGTQHGKDYVYEPMTFLNAIHDVPTGGDAWPGGVDPAEYILSGRRAMIVVYPNE